MSNLLELTDKQVKYIIQHILHHIEDYIVNSTVSLTNQDLRDYQGKFTDII